MAPLLDDGVSHSPTPTTNGDAEPPRFLIIGAGSRGNAYAAAIIRSGLGIVAAIAEPVDFKRRDFASRYIGDNDGPSQFSHWKDFVEYETSRQSTVEHGQTVDGVFVCVKDDLHAHVVTALAPLSLHIMCEKPLATTLADCLAIRRTLNQYPQKIFAIGHVLRYSPHNMLLRHLLLERKVIGDVLSMEHTEPVGWWHFSHSYVRGQWRKESIAAPSLLTKSCHDIDFILWMLCSAQPDNGGKGPHLPDTISSTGSLKQFRKAHKPKAAAAATNCLSCPIQHTCMYSAPRIYHDRHLAQGKTAWPVDIVNPEVGSILQSHGPEAAKGALMATLAEDYDAATTPVPDIEDRQWYGRCVWDSDNDVCDDQTVALTWPDDPSTGKGAKTATCHMIAQTLAQCERRGRLYGTEGEIVYDSQSIAVHSFVTGESQTFYPEVPKHSHHGGGDDGLTECFVKAVRAVREARMGVEEAQREFLGCSMEDVVRSHAVVFAAEEARREGRVVRWGEWWGRNVEGLLRV